MVGISGAWGKYPPSGSYISTGCFKLDHGIGDLNYTAQLTINESGIYATLEAKYVNYCLIYVRTFSGTLINGAFTVVLQRTG